MSQCSSTCDVFPSCSVIVSQSRADEGSRCRLRCVGVRGSCWEGKRKLSEHSDHSRVKIKVLVKAQYVQRTRLIALYSSLCHATLNNCRSWDVFNLFSFAGCLKLNAFPLGAKVSDELCAVHASQFGVKACAPHSLQNTL
jgi:hypothetical protein